MACHHPERPRQALLILSFFDPSVARLFFFLCLPSTFLNFSENVSPIYPIGFCERSLGSTTRTKQSYHSHVSDKKLCVMLKHSE
jgi:hypothetical protein